MYQEREWFNSVENRKSCANSTAEIQRGIVNTEEERHALSTRSPRRYTSPDHPCQQLDITPPKAPEFAHNSIHIKIWITSLITW